jgi:uncharacterized protein (TIGR02466 family)
MTTHIYQSLFPSLTLIDQLEDLVDNDAIVDYCYNRHRNDTRQRYQGGWSSGHLPIDELDVEPLSTLKTEINNRVEMIKDNLGVKASVPHDIRNYWANIFEPAGRLRLPAHPPHMHANYFLSCVYYPKAEEHCGNLVLMSPFNDIERTLPFKHLDKHSYFNASRWLIKPEPAKLIIFPAWLVHYVEDNNSNADRISIAFNISLPQVDL